MSPHRVPNWDSPFTPPPAYHLRRNDLDDYIKDNNNSSIQLLPSTLNFPISLEEVQRACKQGNLNTAPGPDHIPAHFLRHATPIVHQTLRLLFNTSWSEGILAHCWKTANSFCIYKKGNRSDPSSYRIISITSIIIRTFERIVKERLTNYLEITNFFHPAQAGFRHRSAEDFREG